MNTNIYDKILNTLLASSLGSMISDHEIEEIALELEEDIDFVLNNLLNNAKSLTTEEEFMIYEGDKEYPQVKHVLNDFSDYSNFDKVELLTLVPLTKVTSMISFFLGI